MNNIRSRARNGTGNTEKGNTKICLLQTKGRRAQILQWLIASVIISIILLSKKDSYLQVDDVGYVSPYKCWEPAFKFSYSTEIYQTVAGPASGFLRRPYTHFVDNTTCENFPLIRSKSLVANKDLGRPPKEKINVLILDFHGDLAGGPQNSVGMNREFYSMLTDEKIMGKHLNVKILPREEKDKSIMVQRTYLPCTIGDDRERYFNDIVTRDWIQWADVLAMSVPSVSMQMMMPFNKPTILWITTPPDYGRLSVDGFRQWRNDFRSLAQSERVVIVSASEYDRMYTKHFFNVDTKVIRLLSWQTFPRFPDKIPGSKISVGLIPRDSWNHKSWSGMEAMLNQNSKLGERMIFKKIEDYAELRTLDAVIYLPYQKNTNLFIEAYRSTIPIFTPSLQFLGTIDKKECFLSNRNYWYNPPEPCCSSYQFSPADYRYFETTEKIPEQHLFWIGHSEQFQEQFDQVVEFDSISQMIDLLDRANLVEISRRMEEKNTNYQDLYRKQWKSVLSHLLLQAEDKNDNVDNLSYAERMREFWNIDVHQLQDRNVCYQKESVRGIPKRLSCDEWTPFPY